MRHLFKILVLVLAVTLVPTSYSSAQKKAATTVKKAPAKKTTAKKQTAIGKTTRKNGSAKTTKKVATPPDTKEISNLRSEKKTVQKAIAAEEKKLKENQADVKSRLNQLLILNGEIDTKTKTINRIARDIDTLNSNIGVLTHDIDTLTVQLKQRQKRFSNTMRRMQRFRGSKSNLHFIISAKSFTEMYRRIRFLKEYAQYEKLKGEELMAERNKVEAKKGELEVKKQNKNTLLNQGEQERRSLQVKQTEQQGVVNSLKAKQKEIQSVLAEQRKKSAQLNAKIDQLVAIEVEKARKRAEAEAAKKRAEAEARKKAAAEAAAKKRAEAEAKRKAAEAAEARRKAAAEEAKRKAAEAAEAARLAAAADGERKAAAEAEARRKAEEASAAAKAAESATANAAATAKESASAMASAKAAENAQANFVAADETDRKLTGSFESNRGRMPMPITGSYRIISHYGQYNVQGLQNVTLENKGINIQGQAGAKARCIFDGEVSAVFSFDGTMVVMVRHGSYISVYCNLSSVSVSRGQKVSARQILGSVASDHILQFQLRKGTAKLNPEAWVR